MVGTALIVLAVLMEEIFISRRIDHHDGFVDVGAIDILFGIGGF